MTSALMTEKVEFSRLLADDLEIVSRAVDIQEPCERMLKIVRGFVDVAHSFLLDFATQPIWSLERGASVARITCSSEDLRSLAGHLRHCALIADPVDF
ncbi:MAG: hypothetical protein O3A00_08225 [Planctomycetota bacterium]|nr:hypothetical protein [Planctomycetota bacterium]